MSNYYQEIVEVTADYLGPAAERFVKRQIDFHLEKSPEELTSDDVKKLAEWVRVALALLTQDQAQTQEACQRIKAVSEKK
jgi:hypothetical protein